MVFHGGFSWGSGGYLALTTFFVLSGFLITSLLLAEWETTGTIRLAAFWGRRFRRLMPAALLCLAGVVAYGAFVANPEQLWRLRADLLSSLFYVMNWRVLLSGQTYENIFGAPSPLQHFWSLAIEEQFYLLYPLLVVGVLAVGRGTRRALAVVVATLAVGSTMLMVALSVPEQSTARVYFGTDTRAAELLAGALLALSMRTWPVDGGGRYRWVVQALGIAGLAFSVTLWTMATENSRWLFKGGFQLYALVSVVVIAVALRPGPLARVLAWTPFRALGLVSYGVYLYHWPIFLWLTPERTGLGRGGAFAVQLAAILAISAFSYVCLERPIRRGRFRHDRRVLVAAPLAVAAVAFAAVGVTHNPTVRAASIRGPHRPMPTVRDGGAGQYRIMIVGDSLAYDLGRALERWADETQDAVVWNQAVYGCGIARGGSRRFSFDIAPALVKQFEAILDDLEHIPVACESWVDWWPIQVARFRPHVVLVLSGVWDLTDRRRPEWSRYRQPGDEVFDTWLRSEYEVAVDLLSADGARVLWLTHPCIAPKHNLGPLSDAGGVTAERVVHLNQGILRALATSRDGRVELVDLDARVCPGGEFRSRLGGIENARPDGVHLSRPGNRWVAEWLGRQAIAAAATD